MNTFINDLKYGIRLLLKNPGFTVVAVLTLALGIGANTTAFSVVDAVLLRALPLPNADRLVMVKTVSLGGPTATDKESRVIERAVSYPDYSDWRQQSRSLDDLALYNGHSGDLITASGPEKVWGESVSPSYFTVLGAKPALGRTFLAGEDEPGAEPVIVLSHTLWKRNFEENANILGQTVTLGDGVYRVIGVLPEDYPNTLFGDAQYFQYWIPLRGNNHRNNTGARAVGRLKAG